MANLLGHFTTCGVYIGATQLLSRVEEYLKYVSRPTWTIAIQLIGQTRQEDAEIELELYRRVHWLCFQADRSAGCNDGRELMMRESTRMAMPRSLWVSNDDRLRLALSARLMPGTAISRSQEIRRCLALVKSHSSMGSIVSHGSTPVCSRTSNELIASHWTHA